MSDEKDHKHDHESSDPMEPLKMALGSNHDEIGSDDTSESTAGLAEVAAGSLSETDAGQGSGVTTETQPESSGEELAQPPSVHDSVMQEILAWLQNHIGLPAEHVLDDLRARISKHL